MSRIQGLIAEQLAYNYLIAQGLQPITNNYQCRVGEIDLIMRDGSFIVFIEVRSRTAKTFGSAAASISLVKQQKILKTAAYFLMYKYQDVPSRFDVLSIDGKNQKINWIKNAFGLNY